VRVSLLYNRNSGDGVPLDHIRDAIVQHRHDLVRIVEKHADLERLLEETPEIVVAAGGDGTVALAARLLARRRIPLAILPLGTANNIAKSVGIKGSINDVVAGWDTARRRPLDLGVADGVWGRRYFVEAVGGGLMPTAIADMQARLHEGELAATLRVTAAVRTFGEVLSRLQPAEWTIVADGAQTVGEFLLVEVLNIRSIGPNLVFAADADPSDGLFRVVVAGEEHRDEIAHYLRGRLDGRDEALSLPSERARRVTLQSQTDVHVDDQVLSFSGSRVVSIHVEAGAVELLA
jgi:diacylglycerol kinase (ATP)